MTVVKYWAEIRKPHKSERMPITAIVRQTRVSQNAVRRAWAADSPPKYVRPPKGSAVDAVEPTIPARQPAPSSAVRLRPAFTPGHRLSEKIPCWYALPLRCSSQGPGGVSQPYECFRHVLAATK